MCRIHRLFLFFAVISMLLFLGFVNRPSRNPQGDLIPKQAHVTSNRSLKVLNLNMLHGFPDFATLPRRLALLQEQLTSLQPDIVLLQEVPWRPEIGYAAQRLAGDQYAWSYARANGNHTLIRFEEGLAILSRYPLEEIEVHELKPQARPFEHRIVLHALVHLSQGSLHLFVTHLTHRESSINSAQAASLYRYVENVAGNEPALIAGDFNALPEEPAIRQLDGWLDLFAQVHPGMPGYTCCLPEDPEATPCTALNERVDYIFYRPGADKVTLTIEDIQIIFDQPVENADGPIWLSDHLGLLAQLKWGKE